MEIFRPAAMAKAFTTKRLRSQLPRPIRGLPTSPPRGCAFPRIDWRVLALAAIAIVVVGSLAGLAYVFRDQVDPARREQAEQAANNPEPTPQSPDAKIGTRLGGAPAPAISRSSREACCDPARRGPATCGLQRATLFMEVPGAADQSTVAGRVIWRFANLPGKPGQPLDPALVGSVEIPDAGITMRLQITHNRDESLPASYLIGLVFTTEIDGQGDRSGSHENRRERTRRAVDWHPAAPRSKPFRHGVVERRCRHRQEHRSIDQAAVDGDAVPPRRSATRRHSLREGIGRRPRPARCYRRLEIGRQPLGDPISA